MENAEAWMATKVISIHDDLSKGSENQRKYGYEILHIFVADI